jgi:hypothetical protein
MTLAKGVFALTLMQLLMLMLSAGILGFMVAWWLKYPRHVLRWMLIRLSGGQPVPFAMITSDNYLIFDVERREKFLIRDRNNPEKSSGYVLEGDTVNICGFGNGPVYFEECSVPLQLSAQSLRSRMSELMHSAKVPFNAISSRFKGDLFVAFSQLAYSVGLSKAQRRGTLMLYAVAGIAAITMMLVVLLYLQQKNIILALKSLLSGIPAGGTEYGIKPAP